MDSEDPNKMSRDEHGKARGNVTREELYTLVWAEPMLKVAAPEIQPKPPLTNVRINRCTII